MNSVQRVCEGLVWCSQLATVAADMEVIGEIEEPGFLEGGDFTPAGKDLALLGIGLRSNMEAAQQLMDKDLLGARRFAVVKDDFEQHQVYCYQLLLCICGPLARLAYDKAHPFWSRWKLMRLGLVWSK